MSVSIVIPNYNGERILKKNLPKLLDAVKSYRSGLMEVVIADDFSTDDSIKIIEEISQSNKNSNINIKILTSNKNKGFSTNVNKGVAASTGDIIILLN